MWRSNNKKQFGCYLDMAGDMKGVWKWLSFGNHCYKTLCPPRRTRQKSWRLSRKEGAGVTGGCLGCLCPTLKLNSDTSMVSRGLTNNSSQHPQHCQHVVLKIPIQTSISAKPCVFLEFYDWNVSQESYPPGPTPSITETLGPATATTMSGLYGGAGPVLSPWPEFPHSSLHHSWRRDHYSHFKDSETETLSKTTCTWKNLDLNPGVEPVLLTIKNVMLPQTLSDSVLSCHQVLWHVEIHKEAQIPTAWAGNVRVAEALFIQPIVCLSPEGSGPSRAAIFEKKNEGTVNKK